jgi:hypothetical protein
MKYSLEDRSNLYFGTYQYCLGFDISYSFFMRGSTTRFINNMFATHHPEARTSIPGRWSQAWVQQRYDNCMDFMNRLMAAPSPFKRSVYYGSQNIYSNDVTWLTEIGALPYLTRVNLREAAVTRPQDRVQLRQSQHQFRSWFRERSYTPQERRIMSDFLMSRKEYFRITPALRKRLTGESIFNQPTGYDFVDHNSEHDVLMLNMVVANCIKKTLPIEVVAK